MKRQWTCDVNIPTMAVKVVLTLYFVPPRMSKTFPFLTLSVFHPLIHFPSLQMEEDGGKRGLPIDWIDSLSESCRQT